MKATWTVLDRICKKFWAFDPDRDDLVEVLGYEVPGQPDRWWVPELGVTMIEGIHCFEVPNEMEAIRQKLGALCEQQLRIESLICKLNGRMKELL